MFLTYNFSDIQEIHADKLSAQRLRLYLKRDDLLHPHISGNKWRKLKYNLAEMERLGKKKLLTFGGAFSNHIAATAAAGEAFNFTTIGIIRGEKHEPLNATLQFATDCGMLLKYISRSDYRQKSNTEFQATLSAEFGDAYILPEGGTNQFALTGCAEIISEVEQQFNGHLPDYFCVACGTGGTVAGMIQGLNQRQQIIGFSTLKGDFLNAEVKALLSEQNVNYSNWQINTNYHHGGYAKFTPHLIDFITQFKRSHGIALDPVYTGKMMFGIFDLIERGYFPEGSSILAVHTGGLQGISGFNQRFGNLLE